VEGRSPADLDIADLVGGFRLNQLGGYLLERFRVLEQCDRQLEAGQQLGQLDDIGVGRGGDDTLFALVAGKVEFGSRRGRRAVSIVPVAEAVQAKAS